MPLPGNITDNTHKVEIKIYGYPDQGILIYKYAPFYNLQNLEPNEDLNERSLDPLRLSVGESGLDIEKPIILEIEESYDGSANLIISDREHPLKLVNSRFYLISSDEYVIADRKGNLDTNIYTKEDFITQAGLIKTVKSVIGLDFLGVFDGGILPVGNYNFYFKLADFDGNESDFISESGQVVCYIGAVNNPTSIRGGQLNENSEKLVKFKLNNLDLAYDYINVYYTRSTGDETTDAITVHKIVDKFKILGTSTILTISGYEETETLTLADLNIRYSVFDRVKTVASCQNMVFAGNVHNNYELFTILEKYSLFVTPSVCDVEEIGSLNNSYKDYRINGNEYYNPNNIYYKLGYWDQEIYRLGIVYILPDYTLSPVFNIRGKETINEDPEFSNLNINEAIEYTEDYLIKDINGSTHRKENTKGVFKINADGINIFNSNNSIKAIGIKLEFNKQLFEIPLAKISDYTRGFFIVRQKRIPTILAQGLSIATTGKGFIPTVYTSSGYLLESFLNNSEIPVPKLGRSIYTLQPENDIRINALLCPEAAIRKNIFNSLFNSSSFLLKRSKYQSRNKKFLRTNNFTIDPNEATKLFGLEDLTKEDQPIEIQTDLLLIDPETSLINNKKTYFSSVAGNAYEAWKHVDPINGDIDKISVSNSTSDRDLSINTWKTRGIFNSYVGTTTTESLQTTNQLEPITYYNIYNKDYSVTKLQDYFKIRYNDSSPFLPISDRISWNNLSYTLDEDKNKLYYLNAYRGDCYITTYTHRMMWNFTDPELPTNKKIVDPYSWYKNYRVKTTTVKTGDTSDSDFAVVDDTAGQLSGGTSFTYKKVLDSFTYKLGDILDDNGIDTTLTLSTATLLTPEAKKYKKYSESNGVFGAMKINRPDVNAIGLGHWVTFKICSNINLALRDEDFSNPGEEALHKKKRSFYPYSSADQDNSLPESTVINKGISNTLGNRYYFEIPDVPFIKTHFTNRIHYSNLLISSIFKDGSRVFQAGNYQDYTLEYGQLVRLVEWYGTLVAIMEHGILMIPVNERAMMANASGQDIYVNTENVLPKNPRVISNTFGSIWHDGIVKTPRFIYGIDTIGKKIWRTNGETIEIISDMKIQKFLNDNLSLKVTDKETDIIFHLVKAHYNAFKQDIIFVFRYGVEKWVICWNEISNTWVTRYTWFPEFSENINNIFYTFANKAEHPEQYGKLFKHGFAGTYEEQGYIKPTVWYEEQHPFEFEFVAIGVQGIQKIFDNLKIISNKAEPESFSFEIVGEGYDWHKYKEVITWLETNSFFNFGVSNEQPNFQWTEDGFYEVLEKSETNYHDAYTYLLTHTMGDIKTAFADFPIPIDMGLDSKFFKLPYIPRTRSQKVTDTINWNTLGYNTALMYDRWNGEDRIVAWQKAKAMTRAEYRRIKGNMYYAEDCWDIQIEPLKIRYAFMKDGQLKFTSLSEMKVRDKYVKIRVKYDGSRLVIVHALKTLFTISYT